MSDAETEQWEAMFIRWNDYHRLAFGWNGPQGIESSAKLFLYWDKLIFRLEATERELEDATDWMAGFQENFDGKWERHYSVLRVRILEERRSAEEQAKKIALAKEEEEELPSGEEWANSDVRKMLLAKIGGEKPSQGIGGVR